jgi:choice-of-anchor A domain-containing protein
MIRLLYRAVLGVAITVSCHASGTLFTLSPYNGLTFGNFSDTSDFGGGIAAGGAINISSTSVADSLLGESLTQYTGSYTLVSGGNLDATNGTLATGNAYGGGSNNDFSLTVSNGYSYTSYPAADPLNFTALQTQYDKLSTQLANLTTTASCTSNGYGTTTCTANAPGLNVITLSNASLVGANTTVDINLAAGSYLVINVPGTSDSTTNYGIYINGNGADGDSTTTEANDVLFNYYQATALTTYSVVGSVLAPYAAVTGENGQIDGNLIADSFSGPTELHNFGFEGPLPNAAPEPMSGFLIGAGLIALGLARRRARK